MNISDEWKNFQLIALSNQIARAESQPLKSVQVATSSKLNKEVVFCYRTSSSMKDWTVTKNDMKAVMRIGEDNLVYLPTQEIARFWSGKRAEEDGGKQTGRNGAPY